MTELLIDEIRAAAARQRRRYRWTLTGLVVSVLLRGLSALADLWQLWILGEIGRGRVAEVRDVAALNDVVHRLFGVSQILVQVAAGVVFLMWLHGAFRFLQLVGRPSLEFTPNWAVGYWFIPFISLYRPYQIMRELAFRSGEGNPRGPDLPRPGRPPFGAWWTTYLLSNFFGLATLGAARSSRKTLEALKGMTDTLLLSNTLGLVAGICLVAIVMRVQEMQDRLAGMSGTAPAPGGEAAAPDPDGGPAFE